MTQLDRFLEQERAEMFRDLTRIVRNLKGQMKHDLNEYIEAGTDDPSIDIRLCVDRYETKPSLPPYYSWCFRTGLVDFDPSHSTYCAASSVGLETDVETLLTDLVKDLDHG